MDPAGRWPNRFRDVFQKCDDVVVCALLDLSDLLNRETSALSNLRCILLRNLAKLGHRFAGKHFNFEPDLELALVRPNLAHLWSGIAINHAGNIKAGGKSEKRFVKKKNAPGTNHRSDFESRLTILT